MDVTLHVPVRRFVLKYCTTLFGDPWRLTTRHKEGKMMHALLERMPHRYEKYRKDEDILSLKIPSDLACRKGVYLTQDKVDIFNDYIKQVVMDEIVLFHTGIQTNIGLKAIDRVTINQYQADQHIRVLRIEPREAKKFYWQKQIIQDILGKYSITEDDLSSDAVVKYLQRHGSAQVLAS